METADHERFPTAASTPQEAPMEGEETEGYRPAGDLTHPPGEVPTSRRRHSLSLTAAAAVPFPSAGLRA